MRILVTAGPTREYLDDVRYLSNDSSGRMGYALAEAARDAGHEVVLVSGPVHLESAARLRVHSRQHDGRDARRLRGAVSTNATA